MTPVRSRLAVTRLLLPLLVLAGCQDDLTQVVLVVQSDLSVPSDVDGMDVSAIEGSFEPPVNAFFNQFGQTLPPFPLSVGFQSGGKTRNFSAVVRLLRNAFSATPTLVMSRIVTDVRFVDQQTMMLLFPMNRACACQGTSCPSPGNPDCDNMDNPELLPFDPAVAPPSTMMGAIPGGSGVPVTGTAGSTGTRQPPPPPSP
jgi:hypothetical protein